MPNYQLHRPPLTKPTKPSKADVKATCDEVMATATRCITCPSTQNLTPSHAFKRHVHDPADKSLIFPQCILCHIKYEVLNKTDRIQYWRDRGQNDIADKMQKILDDKIKKYLTK